HQYLGDSLAGIAAEKAGILKPGVPSIIGPQSDMVLEVIEARADAIGAPLKVHGRDWDVRTEHGRLVYQDENGLIDLDLPHLAGAHQVMNAGIAIAALRELGLGSEAAEAALRDVVWPARMQRLTHGPLKDALPEGVELWLDGGHNAAAGEAIAAMLDEWKARAALPVHLVVGMLETKSAVDFLRPLAAGVASITTVAIPDAEASFTAERLAEMATEVGSKAQPASSVADAVGKIAAEAEMPARVLICGSLYLAGHVLAENG
ncbi:MAG TPA: bifunctional folylpolyglutamate synthase/dihydrofolate synthase, partial [Paracoccaceae bacterium]|nr:bifunctional folylpolyglutamate synthase/dihydrofolate synthase [Paracoccaceae bacterium]